ncbi:MAG: HAMP domain-containing sensor histidine kinase [Bacteroidota bacterium]
MQFHYQEVPTIFGYPDQLNQVWNNLIHNALEAMAYNGTLEIGISSDETEVVVYIKDDGMGIPPQYKSRIFEPFFTTKAAGQGSGLGLDIVNKVVAVHQGQVIFDSEEGIGSTFWVHLPKQLIENKPISINVSSEIEKV